MSERPAINKAEHFVSRVMWPIVLTMRLAVYGLADSPTHLLLWRSTRIEHAAVYLTSAVLVLITFGRTPKRWLVLKAVTITGVALMSALADLYVNETTSARLNSAAGWMLLATANVLCLLLRLGHPDSREKV